MAFWQQQKGGLPQKRGLLVPLVLLMLLTAGTVSIYLLRTTRMLDQREVAQTTKLAEAALRSSLDSVAQLAYDYGTDDASGKNLVEHFERAWAAEHLGESLFKAHEISASLLFDPQDRVQMSFLYGTPGGFPALGNLLVEVEPLFSQARAAARDAGPASGLIRIDQTLYLAAAQALGAAQDAAAPGKKSSLLVLLKRIDQPLLDQLARNYLLPRLTFTAGPTPGAQASYALNSSTGVTLGYLQWKPEKPGLKIFHILAPAVPLPLILALLLTLLFLRRMQRFFLERSELSLQLEQEKIRMEESEGTLRAIVEAIPSPIFFKDAEGVYLGCNQAFCEFVGLPASHIINHSLHDVAPEDLATVYHQADLDLIRAGGTQSYQAEVRYADGSRRDVLFNKATIVSPGGKVIGLVGIMTDISEMQTIQKESLRLRRLMRNIIDSMPSLLITVDEDQRVTEWNRWAAIATRISAEKALGRPLFEVFPALQQENIDIDAALSSGKTMTWPRIPWRLNDREILVDLTVYPLDKNRGSGAVLRADNTTDSARMEEMMLISEKMLSIGSLAAGMAHEINNPLAIILQHTQILQNRLNPDLSKNLDAARACGIDLGSLAAYLQQRGIGGMLDAIRKAGERAKLIVEEMVNFSQRHETRFAACDLVTLLDETLHLAETDYDLKKKYGYREIEILKEIDTDLPKLTCDRHDIQQVLLNLLRNSARAMQTAKNSKPRIHIGLHTIASGIQLTLTDNGPGIDPSIMSRIFDPFFTTGKTGEGMGLGLSVAYFVICEKHRGRIWAENLDAGGCRFLITLPFLPAEPVRKGNAR